MSELRKYNAGALFYFPLIEDGDADFVSDYTPAAGDAKIFTDKLISTNPTSLILGFDSLSELPAAGATIDENGAGTASGVVEFTVIISGTVGGGDAAGFFFMRSVTGQAWSNNDQIDINGGTTDIATADSTTYDLAATAGLIAEIGNGLFAACLSPTEMTCSQGQIHIIDSATKAIEDQAIQFHTYGNASALHAFDLNTATQNVNIASTDNIALSTQQKLDVNTEADNSMVTYGLDHLLTTAVAGADVADNTLWADLVSKEATSDYDDYVNTTDSLQAISDRLPGALSSGNMKSDMLAISGSAPAADALEVSALTFIRGTATGTPTTIEMCDTSLAEVTDNHYNNRVIYPTSGPALGIPMPITAYTGSSNCFAFDTVVTAMDVGDTYIIL